MVPLVGKLSQNADNVIADEMGVGIPGENLSSGQDMPIEILPGTEIMIESGNIRSKKIPQPSNDPCDPLNWKKRWKISTITTVTYITFTQGFAPLAIAPMMGDLMEAFGCTLADAVEFSGICILVLAFSNFIWVPMSNAYGRRPVLLLSTLIVLASAVWRAKANSYNSFLWACIVDGIGAGPAETIQPAVTAEIFFLESLGKWNTLYWVAYTSSLMMGPIISGSISKHAGWRAFWWLNAALLALGFLMVLFLFPETMYQRPARGNLSRSSTITRSTKRPLEMVDEQNMVMNTLREESSTTQLRPSNSPQNDRWLGMGYPSSEQWKLYQSRSRTWNGIFADLWLPWKLLAFPIIEFGSFVVSFSCSTFLIANLTQDQVFRAAPYHFDSNMIGLTNFAIFFGALLGLYSVGWLGDRVVDRLTARNSNVREPEMRLLAGIPFIFVMILSHIIIAAGYVWHWHWPIIVIIGYGAAGIQVAALPSIASTYVGDCYKPITNSAFVAMTVNKNVWAYGFSKFITPWSEKSGFIPPLMTHMALTTAWCGFGVIFYYFGKTFRRWTKDSKVHWY